MSLQPGTRLGPYEIASLLGSGGMGEVYRARDTRLKREVAIKVLLAEFARDPERLARAQREGEVLASINHPHIAQIYGLEDADDAPCLVMEFVDGETLDERLVHGPIPIEEALELARQMADALEAAHERGVVHRDLKPGNVKITSSRHVKVLDFGLAKPADSTRRVDLSQSPTMPPSMTGDRILGTAAYMSPEQAKGQPADARSDIWSFGVVLFEMLAGKSPFGGDTMADILSAVLRVEPDWSALPADTPPNVRSLIKRCLQKDRHRRLHHMADARIEIEEAVHEPVRTPDAMTVTKAQAPLWIAAMFVAVVATAGTVLYLRPAQADALEARLQIVTPRAARPASLAMSPDGRSVVFEAVTEGKSQLWLRPIDSETAEAIPGTDGAAQPFWSPDSKSIAFFADQKLKRKDLAGGAAIVLSDASTETFGGTWNADGTILFGPANTSPLRRVSDRGGTVEDVTRIDSAEQGGHRFPYFLPDGRRFLFFATGTPTVRGVYVGSLDSKESRRLFDSDSAPVFAPPNHVLFARQGTLFAQRVDPDTLDSTGDPFLVAERVFVAMLTNIASVALSASKAGPLVYRATEAPRQLVWLDRSGNRVGTVGPPDPALQINPIRLSPDGRLVAVPRFTGGSVDLFLIDIARNALRRFTFDDAVADYGPVWSPDGNRVAFQSYRKGLNDLFEKPVLDSGAEQTLLVSPENKNVYDWSPDGRFILYASQNVKTDRDVWALPLEGDRTPFVVANSPFEDAQARLSPDGRWVAYQSNESGRTEIYLRPFPGPGASVQVSTTGGSNPEWRGNGQELFYIGPNNALTAVPVSVAAGRTIATGVPSALFSLQPGTSYAASRDGQRFLVNTSIDENPTAPITVVLNWARSTSPR
jgi:Tol biopolymer transport system component